MTTRTILPYQMYLSNDYLRKNPSWDIEDTPWKAAQVIGMLKNHSLSPARVVEVGCGAGGILAELRSFLPEAKLYGFDIAPNAVNFWSRHKSANISFVLGDFLKISREHFDVLLLMDVLEHLKDPFDFLIRLRGQSDHYILHLPLDLSAITVLREKPLLRSRLKVGHIQYFTKSLALALLDECGYDILDYHYTGATFSSPKRNWRTKLASLPRRLTYAANKDWGVRLLGGETLIALARVKG